MFTLYHYPESSASYRIRIALALKGITQVKYIVVDIRRGEHRHGRYRATNPQQLVPCLKPDDKPAMSQSIAILHWLDNYRSKPELFPTDPELRFQCESFVQQIACDVSPFQKTTLQEYLRRDFDLNQEDVDRWLRHWLLRGLLPVEQALSNRSNTRFAFSDTPCAADCLLVPQIYNVLKWDVKITDQLPNLIRIYENAQQHPVFQSAHPQNFENR